jgi:hypothetical protein
MSNPWPTVTITSPSQPYIPFPRQDALINPHNGTKTSFSTCQVNIQCVLSGTTSIMSYSCTNLDCSQSNAFCGTNLYFLYSYGWSAILQ